MPVNYSAPGGTAVDPRTGRPLPQAPTRRQNPNQFPGGGTRAVEPGAQPANYLGPSAVGANRARNIAGGVPSAQVQNQEIIDMIRQAAAQAGQQPNFATPDQRAALSGTVSGVLNEAIGTMGPRVAPTAGIGNAAQAMAGADADAARRQDFAIDRVGDAGAAAASKQQALIDSIFLVGKDPKKDQRQLAHLLESGARGEGPTAASALFQQNLDRNIAASRAMAGGVRGQSAAGAMRGAVATGSQANLEAGAQAAQLRAQEQQAAQELLRQALATERGQALGTASVQADVLGGVRGQDVSQATNVAGLRGDQRQQDLAGGQAQVSAASNIAELQLRSRALDDEQQGRLLSLGMNQEQLGLMVDRMVQDGQLDAAQALANFVLGERGVRVQDESNDFNFGRDVLPSVIGGVASGGMTLATGAIGRMGGGGAAAPTANSADYLARAQARA